MQQLLQSLFRTAVEGNAAMATTHEQALSLSTTNIQNQFQSLHEIAEKNQEYAIYMASFMVGRDEAPFCSISDFSRITFYLEWKRPPSTMMLWPK